MKLPMLPHAVLEFSRKADDPEIGAAELGRIIETDSGLTAELCRYVNSASFARRYKAATAQQALSILGLKPAKLFLLSTGVQQALRASTSRLMNLQTYWLTSLERSLFAAEVAGLLKTNSDLAYAGSMLHDFLLPVLTNELFDTYFRYLQVPDADRRPLIQYEHATLGWDHPLATAQVLMSWNFPDDLVCCVLLHHAGRSILCDPELGRTAAAAVSIAALLPDALRQSGDGVGELLQLQDDWPEFDVRELARRVADRMAEMTPLAGQHFSLHRRLQKAAAHTPTA
jgi:serine/threonine-protein kinase